MLCANSHTLPIHMVDGFIKEMKIIKKKRTKRTTQNIKYCKLKSIFAQAIEIYKLY